MSAPRIPVTTANVMLDSIGALANTGYLRVYDGTQPTNGGDAVTTQVKLLEFRLAADAFPAASGGVLTANGMVATTALATGIAAWFRLLKSDGTTVLLDGDVGIDGSPGEYDLHIDSIDITIDDTVAVTAFTLTQPLA